MNGPKSQSATPILYTWRTRSVFSCTNLSMCKFERIVYVAETLFDTLSFLRRCILPFSWWCGAFLHLKRLKDACWEVIRYTHTVLLCPATQRVHLVVFGSSASVYVRIGAPICTVLSVRSLRLLFAVKANTGYSNVHVLSWCRTRKRVRFYL